MFTLDTCYKYLTTEFMSCTCRLGYGCFVTLSIIYQLYYGGEKQIPSETTDLLQGMDKINHINLI